MGVFEATYQLEEEQIAIYLVAACFEKYCLLHN